MMINVNLVGVSYQYNKSRHYRSFYATYQNSDKGIKRKVKTFGITKGKARLALKNAIAQRKEWESKYGKLPYTNNFLFGIESTRKYTNEYIIKDNYFILKIKHKAKIKTINVKIDIEHLQKVKANHWYSSITTKNNTVRSYIDGEVVTLRKFLYPEQEDYINFKDRDNYNYRKENVVFDTSAGQYVKYRKHPQTGEAIPGVRYEFFDSREYWTAKYEKGNYNLTRRISIKKLGYESAKYKAEEQRREWEDELG